MVRTLTLHRRKLGPSRHIPLRAVCSSGRAARALSYDDRLKRPIGAVELPRSGWPCWRFALIEKGSSVIARHRYSPRPENTSGTKTRPKINYTIRQLLNYVRYDTVGNRTKLEANFGGTLSGISISGGVYDFSNSYAYDAMHRLTSVTQTSRSGANAVAPKLATFSYNAASQLTDVQRYSATTPSTPTLEVHSRWGYDSAGRLSSITHGKTQITTGQTWDGSSTAPASLGASNTLAAYFLEYDQANRLTDYSSYQDAFKTSYSYDNRDQLTAASSAAISGLTPPFTIPTAESYNLDDNGNRKSSGGASQSASGTHNRLQTDGTYNYEYDAEGNTTKRTLIATGEVTDYTWDHRNRLVSVTEKVSASGAVTQKVEFIYDAFDQRVGKRIDTAGNSTWDRYEAYVWADGHEVLRLVDSDGPGSAESFEVASRYLYADAVDQVLADEQYDGNGPVLSASTASAQAGETLWTLGDHLGSIRDAVDNNGVIRQHVVYDSFGNRVLEVDYNSSGTQIAKSHADAIDILFGYIGRDWDEDVELQYNRARWYDPATGRWLSQDPIGFAAGDANLYRYVGNGPTNATDPSGLQEKPDLSPDPVLSDKYGYRRLDDWQGTRSGKSGTFYQWNYYNRSWFMNGNGVAGPIIFVPDTINGTSDNIGVIGSRGKAAAMQRFGNSSKQCFDDTGKVVAAGFLIGSLFVPGPEDVVLALVGARYGLTVVKGAIYQNGKKLAGEAAENATELLIKTGDEVAVAINRAAEINKMSAASKYRGQLYKCTEYADDFTKRLNKAGIQGERLTVHSTNPFGVWSNSLKKSLTKNHIHEGVRVGDKVYDNMRPNGIPYKDWLDDLDVVGPHKIPSSLPF